MEWTKEKPREPGYYWQKEDGELFVKSSTPPRVVCIWNCADSLMVAFPGTDHDHHLSEVNGEWAGPIVAPL